MSTRGNRVNTSGRVDKNCGKIETVRPFEPSSTVVHPCTSVEGEFCAYTKPDKNRQVIIKTVFIAITKKSIPSL